MTATTFERALTLVLEHEGGWVDDPADPGDSGSYLIGSMIAAP